MDDIECHQVFRGTAEFPKKSVIDHLVAVAARPIEVGVTFAAVLGVVWLALDICIQLFDASPRGAIPLIQMCAVAAIVAFGWHLVRYRDECPEGYESASQKARRIAHLQPKKWESNLALQLLAEKIGPLERECTRILEGKEFVVTTRIDDAVDYFDWMNSRSENYKEMVKMANYLLVREFVPTVVSTAESSASPLRILGAVEALERFYREAIEFERQTRSIVPPLELEKLHAMQIGWTAPARDAIRQLFRVLREIQSYDTKSDVPLNLSIKFEGPANVEEYLEECDRLTRVHTTKDSVISDCY